MKFVTYCTVSLLIVASACTASKQGTATKSESKLDELLSVMTGKFNSSEQAKKDSSYFNISLIMTPIWTDRTDGKWLYVEQAVAATLNKPYRQRVYRLQQTSVNTFTSDIYTIRNEKEVIGAQDNAENLAKLTFNQLELKEGCTVTLTLKNGVYTGGTDADKCPSDLRGAKYASTKITMTSTELVSWDQGFDANGKQVWGATKGGYVFRKQ